MAMGHLTDAAQVACDAAIKAGADFADAVASEGSNRSVSLELGAVKDIPARTSTGISVRAFKRGACAWSSAAALTKEEAVTAGEAAAKLAAVGDPAPDFIALPAGGAGDAGGGLWDARRAGLSIEDLVGFLMPEVAGVRSVAPKAVVNGGCGCGAGSSVLASSRGFIVERCGTSVSCSISATIREDDEVGSFSEYDSARTMGEFAPAGIGKTAAQEALRFLGARKLPSGQLPLILGFRCGRNVLAGIAFHANAEDVQRDRTYLVGKKGERVASEALTRADDPLIPGGVASSATDGEGVRRNKLTVVENGVLCTYLHNSYTAGKAKEPNTGHSTRGGIAPTNCNPVPGKRKLAELIAGTKEGIYLPNGHVGVNATTGDYSQVLDFALKIENGEVAYPVKETMISGSYLDLLMAVEEVSSDYREEPGAVMPGVLIGTVKVVGR